MPTHPNYRGKDTYIFGEIVRDLALQVAKEVGPKLAKDASRVVDDVERALRPSKLGPRITGANRHLATAMQESMLAAYQTEVLDGAVEAYRPPWPKGTSRTWRRYPGKLGWALAKKSMVKASAQGIAYVDADLLTRHAIHWQRLTFGTQGPGGRAATNPRIPVTLLGQRVGTVSLFTAPPERRPRILMPIGKWRGRQFYPTLGPAKYPVKGVQARNYMQAGIRTFGSRFNGLYGGVIKDAVRNLPAPKGNKVRLIR